MIYGNILHNLYPNDTVMQFVGWDCGMCPNPYDGGKPTLHIWMENLEPEKELAKHEARHHDESGHLPDGNCFDFASVHYGLSGQDLLSKINDSMRLNLEKTYSPFKESLHANISVGSMITNEKVTNITQGSVPCETQNISQLPIFSFFIRPVTNTTPYKDITIVDAYKYVTSTYAKERTMQLRTIEDKTKARRFKAANFDYVTFCGKFSFRQDSAVITKSNYLCIDFDDVPNVEELILQLQEDEYHDTELLFRSPTGTGVKWIIQEPSDDHSHGDNFDAMEKYIYQTYGISIDKTGRDMSRACFLSFDPNAIINPKYLI